MNRQPTGDGVGNPFLTRLRLLTKLADAELAALERLASGYRQIRARAELPADGKMHVLVDGWACRYRLLPEGQRQITALLIPGDVCNLDALYVIHDDQTVATITSCTVATLDRATLRDLAARSREVADALGWLGAVENAMLAERNTCLGRRSARAHMAHLLCELLVRLTVVGRAEGHGYTLPLTQEEIADVLGLTSVHVNRVLQSLRADGLIERRGTAIVIRDWNMLRQEGVFRPDYLHLEGLDRVADGLAPALRFFAISPQATGFGVGHG